MLAAPPQHDFLFSELFKRKLKSRKSKRRIKIQQNVQKFVLDQFRKDLRVKGIEFLQFLFDQLLNF